MYINKAHYILIVFMQFVAMHLYCQAISFPDKALVEDNSSRKIKTDQNTVHIRKLKDNLYYVMVDIACADTTKIADIDVAVRCIVDDTLALHEIEKGFHWLPNLTSSPGQIVSQHVFRSPCIIHTLKNKSIILIPDLKLLTKNRAAPYYLSLQYTNNSIDMHYGISAYHVVPHQYYEKSNMSFLFAGKLQMGFYLLIPKTTSPLAVLRLTNSFLWRQVATKYTSSVLPQTVSFARYAKVGYDMALEHFWVDAGKGKGGITLSTHYDSATKEYRGRFFKNDLWYQSWFNNLRTAYGLYYWGGQLQNKDWKEKALQIVNLLMHAPDNGGWFPTLYNTEAGQWIASGTGPDYRYFYYVPDNAWTAYWLLRFNDERQAIRGADPVLLGLGNALLSVQSADGSFPGFVNTKTLTADSLLNHSGSSAMATWYLEELLLRKKIPLSLMESYQQAVKRSLDFLSKDVLPDQKFEDFESYFSCSPKPMHYFDGSTNMFSQNTLSIQWCAEAYLKAHFLFKKKEYLEKGEYCLNILSLYQQVWNPPFISLYTFGGFGAQNSDAEWNDARQAQFADTYLHYYQATGNKEYLERGIYACRASFALMVLPENKIVCPNNYLGTSVNGESWDGSMAENYGHSGYNQRSGQSGFHWGTGSALTTAAIFSHTLGDLYFDFDKKIAEGVDGVVVKNISWSKVPRIATKRIANKSKIIVYSNYKTPVKILVDHYVIAARHYKTSND